MVNGIKGRRIKLNQIEENIKKLLIFCKIYSKYIPFFSAESKVYLLFFAIFSLSLMETIGKFRIINAV